MQQVRAKKFLGQHFLKDLSVAQRIAETISEGRVLEIGPGMGVLTQYLLKNPNLQTTAIEIDRESVAYLKEWYPELHLIEGDFLKLDLNVIYPNGEFCVIGNYPYNISSQIFFKVLDNKDRIPVCSGMIQKEVAERLTATPGTADYGVITVAVDLVGKAEMKMIVDKTWFYPMPKVDSAVVRIEVLRDKHDADYKAVMRTVKGAFAMRRKTLVNNLAGIGVGKESAVAILSKMGLDERIRGERLSTEQFIELTRLIKEGARC